MIFDHLNLLRGSFTQVASRRGLLAAASGGLLAARQILAEEDEAAARKRRKRGNKRKRSRDKRRKQQQPKTRVDSTCSGPASFSFSNPNGTARFAQTFTPIASGKLAKADLEIVKEADSLGDYILQLSPVDEEGVPTNDVLTETTVANAAVPDGASFVPFTFVDPPSVTTSQKYALVLSSPGSRVAWTGNANNPCSGRGFSSLDQADPFRAGPVGGNDFIVTIFIES